MTSLKFYLPLAWYLMSRFVCFPLRLMRHESFSSHVRATINQAIRWNRRPVRQVPCIPSLISFSCILFGCSIIPYQLASSYHIGLNIRCVITHKLMLLLLCNSSILGHC